MTTGRRDSSYEAHLARHRTTWNRLGSFVGDPLVLAAVVPLLRGRRTAAVVLLSTGLAAMVAGHLIEGNLRDELTSVARAPLRSLRHEARFLASLWRAGPTGFERLQPT